MRAMRAVGKDERSFACLHGRRQILTAMLVLDLLVLAFTAATQCADPLGADRAPIVFQEGWQPPLRFYASASMTGRPVLELDHNGLNRKGTKVCTWPNGRYDPARVTDMVLKGCPEDVPIRAIYGDCGVGTAVIMIPTAATAPGHFEVPYQGKTLFLDRKGLPDVAVEPPPAMAEAPEPTRPSWHPPGCEKHLLLESSRRWRAACSIKDGVLHLDLHVNDIGEVQISPLFKNPRDLVVRTVSPSIEGFFVHTIGREGAEALRCGSERHCEDAAFTVKRADRTLGRRKIEQGSRTYDWPISEVAVTVAVPARALADGSRLKLHWIDAYRR